MCNKMATFPLKKISLKFFLGIQDLVWFVKKQRFFLFRDSDEWFGKERGWAAAYATNIK